MAAPSTVAFFIQGSVSLAEVWFIGQLGEISLAAIALAFPLLMLTQTLSGGAMGGAVAAAIARALGAGDIVRAERLVWHALALAVMGGVGLLVIFLLGGRAFLQFLGGEDEVLRQAYAYAVVLLSGSVFLWLIGTVTAIYRGMGEMQFPAAIMIFNALVQIPLSGCLILGWGRSASTRALSVPPISAIVAAALLCLPLFVKLSKGDLPVRLRLSAMRILQIRFRRNFASGPACVRCRRC
jgi:Na+-driven multidrug efflux pump